ncbi:hypothetical protein [Weissella soli]|uniref:Uncharacterized protein n=1 Tax=Weissella soli TaxID=155866 RepID=A0A288QVP3_9LACO|nr:hypothetical protein [Weissella soli]AOT55871.1 hypothetical protein WSWS_00218 [Weissella soli]NKY83683.1 hypothetical protein [Weissella soli]RDL06455.1 hypothetical protein DFP99_0833 [Weissella soli]GEN93493.1 hypothetical protein WSO01_11050 [Weissella soli]
MTILKPFFSVSVKKALNELAILIIFFGNLFINNGHDRFLLNSLSVYLLISIAQSFFKFVLQMTNRISEYSVLTILSNMIYFFSVVLLLIFNFRNFQVLIAAFIFGNLVAMIYGLVALKDLFINKDNFKFFWSWKEAWDNISVGSQLLVANAASMLIVGIVRIGIQQGWGVETFGKVSLTLSISNLLMVFINAISIVIFPKLKRISLTKINDIYSMIRDLLMPIVLTGMLIYFPISYFIPLWLPKYGSTLIYMSILFPMITYQSKFEILSNTFMKVLRMERQLLFINITTLVISSILTVISVFVLHNLTTTVFVIIIVMAIRSTISELYLKNRLHVKFSSEMFSETVMVVVFIVLAWYLPIFEAMVGYIVILILYLLMKKNDISKAIKNIKTM